MTPLEAVLTVATSIEMDQVFNPDLGVQERVLCYEALPQHKSPGGIAASLVPPCGVQAELNKTRSMVSSRDVGGDLPKQRGKRWTGEVSEPIPDLLIHSAWAGASQPSRLRSQARRREFGPKRADLAKLALFSAGVLHYQHRVFFMFNEWGQNLEVALAEIRGLGTQDGPVIQVMILDIPNKRIVNEEIRFSIQAARDWFKAEALKKAEKRRQRQAEREAISRQEEGLS